MNITPNYWDFDSFLLYLGVLLLGLIVGNFSCRKNLCKDGGYLIKPFGVLLMFLPFFLILVFRDISRGNDTFDYFQAFQYLHLDSAQDAFSYDSLIQREPLFNVISLVLSNLTSGLSSDIQLLCFNAMTASLWMLFVWKALVEEGKIIGILCPFTIVFILLFPFSFNILRNLIAMSIMLYAFTFLAKKEYKKYWIFSLIALGFHYTAVISIPIYVFARDYGKSIRTAFTIRFLLVLFLMLFLWRGSLLLDMLFGGVDSRYSGLGKNEESFGIGLLVLKIPLITVLTIFRKDLLKINPHNETYILLMWLGLFVSQICYVNPMFNRITLYFDIVKIFLIPSIFVLLKQKIGNSANIIIWIYLFIWLIISFNYYIHINPYHFMPYISTLSYFL